MPYYDYPFMVPAFLGISGFVIPPSLESSKGMAHFFWKRFLRIAPAFIASLALVALIFGFSFVGPTLRSWYTFGLVNTYSKNLPLWSLACEEVVYLCVAAMYLLGAYKRPAVVWTLWAVATALQAWTMPASNNDVTNIAMLPSAFLIGNLLYIYRERLKVNPWIPVVCFAAMLASRPFLPNSFTLQYFHQSLLIAALVWTGFAGPQIKWRLPLDISYGLYVYHYMIVLVVAATGMVDLYKIIGTSFLYAIPIAILSALLIERPALRLKNWIWWKRQAPPTPTLEAEPAA
ncbi:MAG: hypothetical protein QOJ65_411 [Fimbriimonadaceae bacterium]|nr:hypothetical protein [Fimbriimonadaceae bacterium]